MKLSRVAVLASTAVLSVVLTGLALLSSESATASEAKLPVTPYKFEKIGESALAVVLVDKTTMFSKIDKDGDLLVGAVTQVQVKQTPAGPKTLVDAIVAVCGYNGLMIVKGRSYDAKGALEGETQEPMAVNAENPGVPAGMLYRFLCSNAPKPTEIEPRYKAPQSYTKFWT